ncbi:uncharacterized protein [Solanum lycopersicum]|uniref:uncharacterized protein n=1 Tax=Solanum lycopersicum TaxID=4081 RepID=UPI003749DEC7
MASHLRDFTLMNPSNIYWSMVKEDPHDFIDEVYKILLYMGLFTSEKADFGTYQLGDVAKALYVEWRDYMPLRGGTVIWEIFKNIFIDRFFTKKMRESKVVEFITLRQGGMGVHEYSLKFTKQSKYAHSFVSDPRDEMSRFMRGLSDDLKEECHSAMLHENMNISRLMVHAKHVEDKWAKRKSRDAKRSRSLDSGS